MIHTLWRPWYVRLVASVHVRPRRHRGHRPRLLSPSFLLRAGAYSLIERYGVIAFKYRNSVLVFVLHPRGNSPTTECNCPWYPVYTRSTLSITAILQPWVRNLSCPRTDTLTSKHRTGETRRLIVPNNPDHLVTSYLSLFHDS